MNDKKHQMDLMGRVSWPFTWLCVQSRFPERGLSVIGLNPNVSLLHPHVRLAVCCDTGSACLHRQTCVFAQSFICHNWKSQKALLLWPAEIFCTPVADQRKERKHTLKKPQKPRTQTRSCLKDIAIINTRECSRDTSREIHT